jgi:hypothetical protein
MGDDYPIEVWCRGRVYLDHGLFQDVLIVSNIPVNLLSIYQITHSGSGKKVELTPDSVIISVFSYGSKFFVGEVNHRSRLYTFSHFSHKYDYVTLLTHDNEESRLWHEKFGNLYFKYLNNISKAGMVYGLPHIQYIY